MRSFDDDGEPDGPRLRVLANTLALSPFGGVEVTTLQDAVALSDRGHRVSLMYGADGPLRPDYAAAGVTLRGPEQFTLYPRTVLRDAAAFVGPARWARAQRPDVVWLNRVEHLPWGQAVSRWSGAALVCHLHNTPPYRRMRLVGAGVAHFVAVSEFVRQAYVDAGIEPERITVVPNALPPGAYRPGGPAESAAARSRLGLPADARVVLCYGQLTPAKGAVTLLRAWREVAARAPEALLVLVDSQPVELDPRVTEELQQLDPRSFRLFPVTTDVVSHLHAADVVAFPTQLPETFGRVVIEGMATGRPVVASRVGAVPELLSGPMQRFLVEPGSVDELAAALEGLLDWRQTEPGLAAECIAWVEERYPFDAHVHGLEVVLQRAARRRRRR